jgi:sugar fermentation stimulation protein A
VRLPEPLLEAEFLDRPNRFLGVVRLGGRPVEAHLPDPGRLRELLVPGAPVWVHPRDAARGLRTRYTLCLVRAPTGELVSVVTTWANALVAEALEAGALPELAGWRVVAREVTRAGQRFDFLLRAERGRREMWLEVKSVTLVDRGRGLFPDAVTARGARHVRALAARARRGGAAGLLFVVQRRDARSVTAARAIDPNFADALEDAIRAGVRCWARACEVGLREARLGDPLPVFVGEPP